MGGKKQFYSVRFWNVADECIKVGGKYIHDFSSFEDAWKAANALLETAYNSGAISMDINNDFYAIEE